MANEETNYAADAMAEAWDIVDDFKDEVAEYYCDYDELDLDMMQHDHRLQERVDECGQDSLSLKDAAELLGQLRRDEETDNGLWEGLDPREAVKVQASLTYRNAVARSIGEILGDLGEKIAELYGATDWDEEYERRKQEWVDEQTEQLDEDDDESDIDPDDYSGLDADDIKRSAVQKWVTAYVSIMSTYDRGDYDGLMGKVIDDLEDGDFTSLGVLADKADEQGKNGEVFRVYAK